jgi:hypothetical protein
MSDFHHDRLLARLRRAKDLLCVVENARSAFSTTHNKSGEHQQTATANAESGPFFHNT